MPLFAPALLLLLPASLAYAQGAEQPVAQVEPAPTILNDVFAGVLTPDQAKALNGASKPEEAAALMTPDQKVAARQGLAKAYESARTSAELVEIARGYLILDEQEANKGQAALTVAHRAIKSNPKDPEALAMAANALYQMGRYEDAAKVSSKALSLDPDHRGAKAVHLLAVGRGGSVGNSDGVATSSPDVPTQVQGVAEATTTPPRSGAGVAHSARRALSDLRPTASRHIPLDITGKDDPTPKMPWDGAKAAAAAAAVTVGSIILFLGLLPKQLDQNYPWLKPSMTGGILLAGAAISYDLAASHFIYGRYIAWRLASPSTAAAPAAATAAAPEAAAPAASPAASALPTISMTPHALPQAQQEAQAAAQKGTAVAWRTASTTGLSSSIKKPNATNQRLKNLIDKLFKDSDLEPGGTAGAIRKEYYKGQPTKGIFHRGPGQERLNAANKILKEEPLSQVDRATAEAIRDDLKRALDLYKTEPTKP